MSAGVKVCPVRVTLGIRTDPAVSYDIEFASQRLHGLVRMCRAALCTEPLTTVWAALQFSYVGQSFGVRIVSLGSSSYGHWVHLLSRCSQLCTRTSPVSITQSGFRASHVYLSVPIDLFAPHDDVLQPSANPHPGKGSPSAFRAKGFFSQDVLLFGMHFDVRLWLLG